MRMKGWLSGLRVLDTSRGPGFDVHHPHGGSYNLPFQFQGIRYPILASASTRHSHVGKTPIGVK